jgi:hypothetical protein
MDMLTLIVEGEDDERFLADYIKHHFPLSFSGIEFVKIGGKSEKLHTKQVTIQSAMQKSTCVVLFDADGNFEVTQNDIDRKTTELKIVIADKFLFPDNKSTGTLETLLRKIASNPSVFNCIDSYIACLRETGIEELNRFIDKKKIYIYSDSHNQEGKGSKREYSNSAWDLDSKELAPLKDFLSKHINGNGNK